MKRTFWVRVFVFTIAIYLAGDLLDSVYVRSIWSALIGGMALAFFNGGLKPFLQVLALPLTILTFGIFAFVVNGMVFALVAFLVPGLAVSGLGGAILTSLVVSLISAVIFRILEA